MTSYRGYLSIIQFCPDRARAEAANVGVVLFSPEFGLRVRMSESDEHVHAVFSLGVVDEQRLAWAKRGLARRLETHGITTLAQLQTFVGAEAGRLRLTAPEPVRLTELADDIERFYDRLVRPPAPLRPQFTMILGRVPVKIDAHNIVSIVNVYGHSGVLEVSPPTLEPIMQASSNRNTKWGPYGAKLTH